MRKGIEYFQQAIDKDPAYALAYAGLADCYSILSLFQILRPKEGFARAKAAAASAVALDPELAEGRTSLAFIRAYADWDWAEAENEFRRAIELNPSYWVAPYWYGVVLTNIGRNDEGREQIRKARELEPLSPIITNVAAWNLIAADRYGEAIECCLKGLEIDANYALLRHWLGLAYEAESRYEEAIGELGAALRLFEGASVIAGSLAHAHALAGNHAEARRLLDGLLDPSDQRYVDPYSIAIVHAGLGERDRTLELVEKACNDRSAWLGTMAKTDPRLDNFRSDPRFRKILQRMGLNE